MSANLSPLLTFLFLLILMVTVSNYFTVNRTGIIYSAVLAMTLMEIKSRASETENFLESDIRLLLASSSSSSSSNSDILNEYSLRSQADLLESVSRNIHQEFYQRVSPEAICKDKVRIGEVLDGGKYVCKPTVLVGNEDCTILSLGLNNQIGFDQHIAKVTGGKCRILGADMGAQSKQIQEKYAKINGELFVGKIPGDLQLPDMMKRAGRTSVDMLKIDIEEGERTGLEPLLKEYPVCQIFIEIHGKPLEHLPVLQMMAKYNFRIFNVDPNYRCAKCCEYSLIHESCMEKYGVIPLGITIPKKVP